MESALAWWQHFDYYPVRGIRPETNTAMVVDSIQLRLYVLPIASSDPGNLSPASQREESEQ